MKSASRIISSTFLVIVAVFGVISCATAPQVSKTVEPVQTAPETDPMKIVVAKVNDVPLHMGSYIDMLNSLPDKAGPETLEERKLRALDALTLKELAYQRAVSRGIAPDPVSVETAFMTFRDNVEANEPFTDFLTKRNLTEAGIRAGIEREQTINLIHKQEVMDKIIIPEAELKSEYDRESKYYITVEKMKIIDVFLLRNEGKKSQKKAKDLLKKIQADPKKDPWKLVLDGTFIVRRYSANKDRDKAIYNAGKKMKAGDLSGVIRDSQGLLHIFKLEEYIPKRSLTYDELKPILEEKMKLAREGAITQEWEQGLKQGAKIELFPEVLGGGQQPQEQKQAESSQDAGK